MMQPTDIPNGFEEIPGELDADRNYRLAQWRRSHPETSTPEPVPNPVVAVIPEDDRPGEFPDIPGERFVDRVRRYRRWVDGTVPDYPTESERIAASQGLDPNAHLTRRELKARKRHARQKQRRRLG